MLCEQLDESSLTRGTCRKETVLGDVCHGPADLVPKSRPIYFFLLAILAYIHSTTQLGWGPGISGPRSIAPLAGPDLRAWRNWSMPFEKMMDTKEQCRLRRSEGVCKRGRRRWTTWDKLRYPRAISHHHDPATLRHGGGVLVRRRAWPTSAGLQGHRGARQDRQRRAVGALPRQVFASRAPR